MFYKFRIIIIFKGAQAEEEQLGGLGGILGGLPIIGGLLGGK